MQNEFSAEDIAMLRILIAERKAKEQKNMYGELGPKPPTRVEVRDFFFLIPRKLPNKTQPNSNKLYWLTTKRVECMIDHKIMRGIGDICEDAEEWIEVIIPLVVQE